MILIVAVWTEFLFAQGGNESSRSEACQTLANQRIGELDQHYQVGLCLQFHKEGASAVREFRESIRQGFQTGTSIAHIAGIFLITNQPERTAIEVRQLPNQKCNATRYHDLDFWLGSWEIESSKGRSRSMVIEPVLGGCAIWATELSDLGTRRTLMFYDPITDMWIRDELSENLDGIELTGARNAGHAEFNAVAASGLGASRREHRIISPVSADEIMETRELSRDDGVTWINEATILWNRSSTKH